MKPFLEGLKPTLHISHRGGAKLMPENTLEAFRRAVDEFKTDMLELDVHVTRDGEVVVAHDATLERCTNGAGEVSAKTLAELQALDAAYHFQPEGEPGFPLRGQGVRIPTLREVLRAFPDVRVNVELKDTRPGTERTLVEVITSEKALARVCIGSESDEVAARIYEAAPEACHFYPREALAAFVLTLKSGGHPPDDPRFSVLAMPLYFQGVRLVDPQLLDAAHQMKRFLSVWTVDDPGEMRRLVIEGVGGVMTDRPDLLRQAINTYGRPRG